MKVPNPSRNVALAFILPVVALMALVSCEASSKPNGANTAPATTKPAVRAEATSTVSIELKWEDLGPDMMYEVFRGTTADFEPTIYSSVRTILGKAYFNDDQLDPATTYFYKVYGRKVASTVPATHIGDISAKTPATDGPIK